MFKFIRNILGYCLAGTVISSMWKIFTNHFGYYGGWLAAFFLTGTLWFINHYLGFISNKKEAAFVDMGLGVGICLTAKGILVYGADALVKSLPTFICITIGAVCAGLVTGLMQRETAAKTSIENEAGKS